MRANTKKKHGIGRRFAIVIGVAAVGAAVVAVGASATFRSVDDPRGDTGGCRSCSDRARRDADIVRATAGHEGGRLRHTIRVVGKFKDVTLLINTDSDQACEYWVYFVHVPLVPVRDCGGGSAALGPARVDVHLHSAEISFSKRSIGFPRFYGWSASTFTAAGGRGAVDHVPNPTLSSRPNYIRHWLR
jgi:hypothetical protein